MELRRIRIITAFVLNITHLEENTPCDDCIITATCLFVCVLDIARCCVDVPHELDFLADCLVMSVQGCMHAQQQIEINEVKKHGWHGMPPMIMQHLPPSQQEMMQKVGMHGAAAHPSMIGAPQQMPMHQPGMGGGGPPVQVVCGNCRQVFGAPQQGMVVMCPFYILPHRQSGLEPTQASSRTPSVASGLRPVTSPLEGGPTLPEAEAGAAGGPVALPAVPREVASTPSPSRSSPAALSTPWGEMEAAVEPSPKSGPTPKSGKSGPSPKSGFELGSPSRLPETLAEQRQQDMEAPVAPEFNEAETPLLRLEPAPCGSEIRTVAQTYEDQQLAEPSSPLRRSPIPALSMSWAEMEAAALEPTPK
eukprot:g18184.t1